MNHVIFVVDEKYTKFGSSKIYGNNKSKIPTRLSFVFVINAD